MIQKNLFIRTIKSLTWYEALLWLLSLASVSVCYAFVPQKDVLTLISSLFGVSLVLFVAKGTVLGEIFTVFFSVFYGILSLKLHYYSEMITYLGMNTPIAIATMIEWIKNPYKDTVEVKVAHTTPKLWIKLFVYTTLVTTAFYFILKALGTANLVVCTISIATSFAASYLQLVRSSYYAIGFMLNDSVLILLWTLASVKDKSYISMIICVVVFLINDIYGFINWQRMKREQTS